MATAPPERSKIWYLRRSVWRDARNLIRHGTAAPKWGELIWVDPGTVTTFVSSHNRSYTGQVIGGDWDLTTQPLLEHEKILACRQHWVEGVPWEDTGIIELIVQEIELYGSKDGCTTRDEVVARYRHLDDIFDQVKTERRLRTRREVDRSAYREVGGIYMHFDRENTPVFGNGGCHRLAIAQVLGLESIPAQVGVVHEEALKSWRHRISNL